MFSCSHQSTFDRLYAREKKLYQEVRVHLKSSAWLFEWCILSVPSFQGHDYKIEFQCIYLCTAAKRRSTQDPNRFKEIWSSVVSWMRQKHGNGGGWWSRRCNDYRENGWNCHKGTLCRNVSCNELTDWICYWFCREGYAEYVKQWENAIAKCSRVLAGLEHNLGYPGG